MVFDLQQQSFPFIQAFVGGFFLYLGINLRIEFITKEEQTEE